MRKHLCISILITAMFCVGCSDGDSLLNDFMKDGPIFYAGKIDSLNIQSGYYRIRVNIFPSEDVNRSFCILRWNESDGLKDSVQIEYKKENFDDDQGCYFTYIEFSSLEGNLQIESQNVDIFGNRSLNINKGAFIYGDSYRSTLLNSEVNFTANNEQIIFENRIGVVGNWISYEKDEGGFTPDSLVLENIFTLINPKHGGIIRTRTLYQFEESDIDTLVTNNYTETLIP